MDATISRPGTSPRGSALQFRLRLRPGRILLYVFLCSWAVLTTYPFIWLVLVSLKSNSSLYTNPFGLPKEWLFQNYATAWVEAHVARFAFNSLIVTAASTVLAMFLASTCAFVFSRFDFRFKSLLWVYIILGMLVPDTMRLLPLAMLTRTLHIYDSLLGLIVVYAASAVPWNTFFLRSFMETIPRELEEAAVIDGASMWHVFWNVILPLSRPGVVTMATFQVLHGWNEFILALLLTSSEASRTLPVGIRYLIGQWWTNETALAAAMVIAIIPAVVFFLFLQRYVVKGMMGGSLAGI